MTARATLALVGTLALLGCAAERMESVPSPEAGSSGPCLFTRGLQNPCIPFESPAELETFLAERHELMEVSNAIERERARQLDVDHEDILYAALAPSLPSTAYCLYVFGDSPSDGLKRRLSSSGHPIANCGIERAWMAIDSIEPIPPDRYRVYVRSHCGRKLLCGEAGWYHVRHDDYGFAFDKYELDWNE